MFSIQGETGMGHGARMPWDVTKETKAWCARQNSMIGQFLSPDRVDFEKIEIELGYQDYTNNLGEM